MSEHILSLVLKMAFKTSSSGVVRKVKAIAGQSEMNLDQNLSF